jgi:hypothetical protein
MAQSCGMWIGNVLMPIRIRSRKDFPFYIDPDLALDPDHTIKLGQVNTVP